MRKSLWLLLPLTLATAFAARRLVPGALLSEGRAA